MRLLLVFLTACSAALAFGQIAQETSQKTPEAIARDFQQALDFRRELIAAVVAGTRTPAEAFARLQAFSMPAGFDFGPEAGLAIAATDIGQSLIASGKPSEAELFFSEAEKSLGTAIDQAKDSDAKVKAGLLEQRAFLRANFLNKTSGADEDLAAAIKLLPEDKRLQQKRDLLPAARTGRKPEQSKD